MSTFDRMAMIEEIKAMNGFELTAVERLEDLADLQLTVLRDGLAAAADESLKN